MVASSGKVLLWRDMGLVARVLMATLLVISGTGLLVALLLMSEPPIKQDIKSEVTRSQPRKTQFFDGSKQSRAENIARPPLSGLLSEDDMPIVKSAKTTSVASRLAPKAKVSSTGGGGGGGWDAPVSSAPAKTKPAPTSTFRWPSQAPTPAQPPRQPSGGVSGGSAFGGGGYAGGGVGGGGSYSGGGITASATGAYGGSPVQGFGGAPVGGDPNYFVPDDIYGTEAATIENDTQALLDELKRQRGGWQQEFSNAVRNLGYDAEGKQWQKDNRLGAYGLAYQNQLGDFANRGLLTSSFYGRDLDDLTSGFQRQYGDLVAADTQDKNTYDEQVANATKEKEQALLRARTEAIARRAAGLSLF